MKLPASEQWLYFFNILVSRWVNSGKDIGRYTPSKILCVKWDEIGDMTACTHVFSLLKKRFPGSEIHVLTKKYSAALIENHPDINRVLTDINEWNSRYDFVIELRGTWRTLFRTFRYYPRIRLDRGIVRLKHRGKQLHETLTNYEIILPVLGGLPYEKPRLFPSENNRKKAARFLESHQISAFALIHPGARRELRRWTPAGFSEIADFLHAEKKLSVIFTGTAEEHGQIQAIIDRMKAPAIILPSDFSLLDLAALMERADLFIGNESGPLQIADVMGVPLTGLFGPGVKDVFYPQNPHARVLHHVLDCNPCDQIHCVRPENPCMNLITAEEVKSAVDMVLKS